MTVSRNLMLGMGDVDASGNVFFPRYFHWADEGLAHLLRVLGHPIRELLAGEEDLAVVATEGRFFAPVGLDEELVQETGVREVRNSSAVIGHEFRTPGGTLVATVTVTVVSVTYPGMNPHPVPDWLRRAAESSEHNADHPSSP